ncbi:MAG: AhpC/TSA family protein [Caulobacterales bacterium]|nr:AhpC/TSA family protein [Caulobacterales bacterium]
MTSLTRLAPRETVPDFDVRLTSGEVWRLSDQRPENFTLMVFYRGLHCPICRAYLTDLTRTLEGFDRFGVKAIAISSDAEDRARQVAEQWGLGGLDLGYGLALEDARKLGLYISSGIGRTSIGVEEPARFSEPGVFIVRSDRSLYYSSVQTMPFARPDFAQLLRAVEFAVTKNYPARGEVTEL